MNKPSNIILPEDVAKKHVAEYVMLAQAHLMKEAKKEMERIGECEKCHRKDRLKLIPLHEEPSPLPTRYVMFCDNCKFNKAIMARESDKRIKYYNKEIQKMIDSFKTPEQLAREKEKVIKDNDLLDKLVPTKAPVPTTK